MHPRGNVGLPFGGVYPQGSPFYYSPPPMAVRDIALSEYRHVTPHAPLVSLALPAALFWLWPFPWTCFLLRIAFFARLVGGAGASRGGGPAGWE